MQATRTHGSLNMYRTRIVATGSAKWAARMLPRIIQSVDQYRRYQREVEALATEDPPLESPEGARLELLAKFIEDYEKARYEFARPDPEDAILFRMEQQGLRQQDI